MDLQFEWDDEKSRANRRKHGVTFAEAASVFFDPRVVTLFDEGHSVDED